MTQHKIICDDSRNMKMIPDKSVQLIVTSPPYPMIEMWDEMFAQQDRNIENALDAGDGIRAFLLMHEQLNKVWNECDRVLEDNGFICINIGDATRTLNGTFQLYSNHTQIINTFVKMGYNVLPDIHWRKQSNTPNKFMGSGMYPAGAYVTYEHEYILIFRKGGKRVFQGKENALRHKSAFFWEERNVWFSDLWEIKGTSQIINAEKTSRERSAAYPFEIPYRLVNMYSAEGDTVLDPFAGLGTTSLACMTANRNSVSVEIDQEIAELCLANLDVSIDSLNRVIDTRLKNHCDFIDNLSNDKREKCYMNPHHAFAVKTRQETKIQINHLTSIVQTENCIVCSYE